MLRFRIVGVIAFICTLLGYFGCGLALKHGMSVPAILYWSFFLAIPCISILLISNNEGYNVILLLVVSFSVYSIYFLQNITWYPSGRDVQFELENVALIYETGKWYQGMGTSMAREMSVHPAMYFLLASFCYVTGFEPYQAMFIVPWLKGIGFTLFFYLFSRNMLADKRIAFLSSLVYLGCFSLMIFPHREVFTIVLFMGLLWTYICKKTNFELGVVQVLFVLSLAISHHFTAYIFLLLITALNLFSEKSWRMISPYLPVVVIFSWIIFISFEVFNLYSTMFLDALQMVLTLNLPGTPGRALSYFYTPIETFFLLGGPILVSILALPDFLRKFRTNRKSNLVVMTWVLGILLIVALSFFKTETYNNSTYRVWGFAFIVLSVWASHFLWEKLQNEKLRVIASILIVAFLFTSMNLSLLSGIKRWYVPCEYMEEYVFSDSMVNTAEWCNVKVNGSILGDTLAYNFIGSWGRKNIEEYIFYLWYQTGDNELAQKFEYIILSPWDTVTYGTFTRKPINPFALLPKGLNIVYASPDFIVYHNTNQ